MRKISKNKNKNNYKKQYNSRKKHTKGNIDAVIKNGSGMLNIDTGYDYEDSFNIKSKIFQKGIVKEFNPNEVQKWIKRPEDYKDKLRNMSSYYYISNGDISQLIELGRTLPTLNYKIGCLEKDKQYEKNITLCNRVLKEIDHKELTRDIVVQLMLSGTVTGILVGDKKNGLFPVIFDDLEYFFPALRRNGKWCVWCDLSYFNQLTDIARDEMFENLDPYVTKLDYERYLANSDEVRYIELPAERTICIRTHTLSRNQRFGIPWATQAVFDLIHKKKLKDLEKSVANKIINAVAVLTIGNEDNPNLGLPKTIKKKIYSNTKQALKDNSNKDGITVIGLPDFANLEFPKSNKEPLDPAKYESINKDIQNGLGYSKGLITGNEGNFATNKLSLDILYIKISEMLERIESEVFNKLIALLLNKSASKNYYLEYDKTMPLSKKEKLDTLYKLHTLGYTVKPIVEIIGENYDEFIEQTLYEIETKKLRTKVIPPTSSYTLSDKSDGGKPIDEDNENNNTVISKENDGNRMPKANIGGDN